MKQVFAVCLPFLINISFLQQDQTSKKPVKENGNGAKATKEPIKNVKKVMSKILSVLKTIMRLCSLEVTLRLKHYLVSLKKTPRKRNFLRCHLIFDTQKGRIRVNIHRSSAAALLIPPTVMQAVSTMNNMLKRIPMGDKMVIFKIFSSLSTLLTTKGHNIDVINNEDDFSDFNAEDEISVEQALSTATLVPYNKLLFTLSTLNVRVRFSEDCIVDLKRRGILATVKRQTVVIDAMDGLQIAKEPRVFFKRQEAQNALNVLATWITCHPSFNTVRHFFEAVKMLTSLDGNSSKTDTLSQIARKV